MAGDQLAIRSSAAGLSSASHRPPSEREALLRGEVVGVRARRRRPAGPPAPEVASIRTSASVVAPGGRRTGHHHARSRSRCAPTRSRRRRPRRPTRRRPGSGASPGGGLRRSRVGQERRPSGARSRTCARTRRRSGAARARASTQAEGGGVPEGRGTAVAERHLVALGEANSSRSPPGRADQARDRLLAMGGAHHRRARRRRGARSAAGGPSTGPQPKRPSRGLSARESHTHCCSVWGWSLGSSVLPCRRMWSWRVPRRAASCRRRFPVVNSTRTPVAARRRSRSGTLLTLRGSRAALCKHTGAPSPGQATLAHARRRLRCYHAHSGAGPNPSGGARGWRGAVHAVAQQPGQPANAPDRSRTGARRLDGDPDRDAGGWRARWRRARPRAAAYRLPAPRPDCVAIVVVAESGVRVQRRPR